MCTIAGRFCWLQTIAYGKLDRSTSIGVRIGSKDLLHQLFLLQHDRLAVHILLAVGGRRALVPSRIAVGMVADHHDRHVGLAASAAASAGSEPSA